MALQLRARHPRAPRQLAGVPFTRRRTNGMYSLLGCRARQLPARWALRGCGSNRIRAEGRRWRAFSPVASRCGHCSGQRSAQLVAFFEGFDLPELLRATAWRTSALKADSSTSSPSWMSIARREFPSRLELKRRTGSFRDAPLKKVSFTTFL